MGFGDWFRRDADVEEGRAYDSFSFADRLVGVQQDWRHDGTNKNGDFVLNADGTCTSFGSTGPVTVVDETTIIAGVYGINCKIEYKKIEDGTRSIDNDLWTYQRGQKKGKLKKGYNGCIQWESGHGCYVGTVVEPVRNPPTQVTFGVPIHTYDSFSFADRLVGVQQDWRDDGINRNGGFVFNADGTCTSFGSAGPVTVVDETTIIARFHNINHKIEYKKIGEGYYVGTVVEPVRNPPTKVTSGDPYDSFSFADGLVGAQQDWWGYRREHFVLNADGTCATHHGTGQVTVVDETTIIARFNEINHKIKYKKIDDGYYVGTVVEPVRCPIIGVTFRPTKVTFGGEAPWYWDLPDFFVNGHVYGFPLLLVTWPVVIVLCVIYFFVGGLFVVIPLTFARLLKRCYEDLRYLCYKMCGKKVIVTHHDMTGCLYAATGCPYDASFLTDDGSDDPNSEPTGKLTCDDLLGQDPICGWKRWKDGRTICNWLVVTVPLAITIWIILLPNNSCSSGVKVCEPLLSEQWSVHPNGTEYRECLACCDGSTCCYLDGGASRYETRHVFCSGCGWLGGNSAHICGAANDPCCSCNGTHCHAELRTPIMS